MIKEHFDKIVGTNIHYYSNDISEKKVLLLHGFSFQARTWKDLGTLDVLENAKIGTIALDFPGFGKSEQLPTLKYDTYPFRSSADLIEGVEFIKNFIIAKMLHTVAIVGPSMGGQLAMNVVITYPQLVNKLVLIAPVGAEEQPVWNALESVTIPILLLRGMQDTIVSEVQILLLHKHLINSKLIQYPNAGHPCYLNVPEQFHKDLVNFLK